MNKDELISYIQSIIDREYQGVQAEFAKQNGISPAYVNDIVNGRREPGQKILDIINCEKVTIYRIKK